MTRRVAVVGGRQHGKTALAQLVAAEEGFAYPPGVMEAFKIDAQDAEEFKRLYKGTFEQEAPPATRLSIDPKSPDFHPSYVRVGVRVDGVERNDLQWYDSKRLEYMTTDRTSHLATSIEPYWRFAESRQQRRARERWEGKHK